MEFFAFSEAISRRADERKTHERFFDNFSSHVIFMLAYLHGKKSDYFIFFKLSLFPLRF